MAALGISSTCVSADTLEEDKSLWKRVKAGEFQLVYACPEELFKARGEFILDVARDVACPFIKNLVAVAIDECHLVHEWEDFRKEYGQLGRFRSLLPGVPFLCLSATLSRNTASYVHKTCRLADRTVMFNLPIRRDNINLVISKTGGSGIDPLLARIPQLGPDSDLSVIPKTLIFYDKIDPGIDLANILIQRLPQTVSTSTNSTNTSSAFTSSAFASSTSTIKKKRKGEQPSQTRDRDDCECQRHCAATTQSPTERN